jgi:thiamine pyrophosphokinase
MHELFFDSAFNFAGSGGLFRFDLTVKVIFRVHTATAPEIFSAILMADEQSPVLTQSHSFHE